MSGDTMAVGLHKLASASVIALALASCSHQGPGPYDPFGTGQSETPRKTEGLGAPPERSSSVAAAGDSGSARPPHGSAASGDQRLAAHTKGPALAPSLSGLPTNQWSGLSEEELRRSFGKPDLVRNEAGGTLWQYRGKGCVVLAYLYPGAGGGLETAYTEAHPGGADDAAIRRCLQQGVNVETKDSAPSARKGEGPILRIKPKSL